MRLRLLAARADAITRRVIIPSRFYRGAGYRGGLYGYDDFGFGFDVREIVRYEANAEIIMGSGEKPSDPAYFNAEEVIVNLAGNITRPEVS